MRQSTLARLQERRDHECRLTPDRALESLDEAADFLAERRLLTRTSDSALPSLFGACHESPGRPGGRGFDLWPRTKWIWSFQLTRRPGTLLTKLHRGRSLFLSAEGARIFDPLVRQSSATATGDDATFLEHLAEHGDSTMDDMELELGWDRNRLKRTRDRLQRTGAVVGEGLVFEDASSWHFAPLRRWDRIVAPTTVDEPVSELIVAALEAAVLAPESDVGTWFTWPIPAGAVDRLVTSGRVIRPAQGWLAVAD